MMKLWYRSKEVLTNKVFFSIWVFFHKYSTFTGQQWKGEIISFTYFSLPLPTASHKENIQKTRETINPIVDTKKLWVKIFY